MEQPKISVIVPVYKVEPYLQKCLDSIIDQTYQNLEIILVDDGSPDNCGAICDEYAARDTRIRVIHKENGGVASARNAGLAAATGEWIGFVDSDDYIESDTYEYLFGLASQLGTQIAQCGTYRQDDTETDSIFCADTARSISCAGADLSLRDWEHISNSVWDKLFLRKSILHLKFSTDYPIGEDLLFCVDALGCASSIAVGSEAKYHYVQRADSVCHASPTLKKLTSYRSMIREILSRYDERTDSYCYFWQEQFRNDMDMCSKIVRFWQPEFEHIRVEIRHEIRKQTGTILTEKNFSGFERAKLLLIGWSWGVYRTLIRKRWRLS